ncbi:MAG: hypothetical protein J6Z11_06810 [Candidatus Riflebacteria bacterium]|nr:hypothetical protein [Candidatus Riflebacteria bacterium]
MKQNKQIAFYRMRINKACWCVVCAILVSLLFSKILFAQEPERLSKKEAKAVYEALTADSVAVEDGDSKLLADSVAVEEESVSLPNFIQPKPVLEDDIKVSKPEKEEDIPLIEDEEEDIPLIEDEEDDDIEFFDDEDEDGNILTADTVAIDDGTA